MNAVLSVMMLLAFALVAGAIWLLRRGEARTKAWLMLVLAAVIVANVLLWPKSGDAPELDRAAQGGPGN